LIDRLPESGSLGPACEGGRDTGALLIVLPGDPLPLDELPPAVTQVGPLPELPELPRGGGELVTIVGL